MKKLILIVLTLAVSATNALACRYGSVTVYNMNTSSVDLSVNGVPAGTLDSRTRLDPVRPIQLCRVKSTQDIQKGDIAQDTARLTYEKPEGTTSVQISLGKDFQGGIITDLTLVIFGDKTVIQEYDHTVTYENR
jgi:hypothetical protein